jgi:antitoxin MazE
MKAKIELIDGNAAVKIPASVMSASGLSLGTEVEIYVEGGSIVLAQLGGRTLIDRLIDGITPTNVHKEIGTGGPVGNEVLRSSP